MNEFVTLMWMQAYTLSETEIEFRITVSTLQSGNVIHISFVTSNSSYTFPYSTVLNISRCVTGNVINFTVNAVDSATKRLGEKISDSILIPQDISLCESKGKFLDHAAFALCLYPWQGLVHVAICTCIL